MRITNTGDIDIFNELIIASLSVTGDVAIDNDVFVVNTTTNRVGINNGTPSYELDVSGDINTTGVYRVGGLEVLSSTTLASIVVNSSLTSVGNLIDLTVDTNTLVVDATGNAVGIGITNPSERFHVTEDSVSSTVQGLFENTNASGSAGIRLNNGSSNFNIEQDGDTAILTNVGGDISYLAQSTGKHTFFTTDTDIERLRIENGGNVGVGKSPSYNLDVSSDINTDGLYRINGTEVFSATGVSLIAGDINFSSTTRIEHLGGNVYINTTDIRQFAFTTLGDFEVYNGNIGINVTNPGIDLAIGTTGTGLNAESDNELAIYTNGTEAVRIDLNGLMGINQTNPLFELDVNGTINFTGQILQNGSQLVTADGIWTQQGTGAYITQGGAIGIGTTTPSAQLHVEGNGIISGNISIGISTATAELTVEGIAHIGNDNGIPPNRNIGDFQSNNEDGTIHFIDTPWVYSRAIESWDERGSGGTALVFGVTKTDNTKDNIALITKGNTNLLVDSNENITITNDLTVGSNTTLTGTLGVTGNTTMTGTLDVTGDAAFDTNTLYVDASANSVGIGTTLPQKNLHIHESGSGGVRLLFTNDTTGQIFNTDGFEIGIDSNENTVLRNRENTNMEFFTNDTQRMIITAAGLVGLGNFTPTIDLAIGDANTGLNQGGEDVLQFMTGGVERGSFEANGDFVVETDTLFVDVSADRVGINESSPTEALDVTGNILSTGTNLGRQRACSIGLGGSAGSGNSVGTGSNNTLDLDYTITVIPKVGDDLYDRDFEYNNGYADGTITSVGVPSDMKEVEVPQAGLYEINFRVNFASNATGYRQAEIRINGSTTRGTVTANAVSGVDTIISNTWRGNLSSSDIITIRVFQNSGGALNVGNNGEVQVILVSSTI